MNEQDYDIRKEDATAFPDPYLNYLKGRAMEKAIEILKEALEPRTKKLDSIRDIPRAQRQEAMRLRRAIAAALKALQEEN